MFEEETGSFEEEVRSLREQLEHQHHRRQELEKLLARRSKRDYRHLVASIKHTLARQPKITLSHTNRIVSTNSAYSRLTGYSYSDIQGKEVQEFVPELTQFPLLHPLILALEDIDIYLAHVPVTVRCKDSTSLDLSADIILGSDQDDRYDSAEIFFEERRTNVFHTLAQLVHRRNHTAILRARDKEFSERGFLGYHPIERIDLRTGDTVYSNQQPLCNRVISVCFGLDEEGKDEVLVDFKGIHDCDPAIYRAFGMLSRFDEAKKGDKSKIHFVNVSETVYRQFIHVGFPKKYMQREKKHRK